MTKNIKDLGQLKRELEMEIPLEEIKPAYDQIFQELKSVKMRGFRPGKFPKAWLQKRFQEEMTVNAREQVIPHYFNQVVAEMNLRPASPPSVEELSFEAKKPLRFKVSFEVCPDLPPLDYQKLKLEEQEIHTDPQDHENMIEDMRKDHATLEAKPADSVAEEGDIARVDYQQTVGEEVFEEIDESLELDEEIHPAIKSNLLGMKVGEHKTFSFETGEEDEEKETVTFELTLKGLEKLILPEMNEEFFKKFGNSQNEEEFRQYVEKQVEDSKKFQQRHAYYEDLKEQLPGFYEDFELPEKSLAKREKEIEKTLQESEPEMDEEAKAAAKESQMAEYKTEMRVQYILDQIFFNESLTTDQNVMAHRMTRAAQMMGVHPDEFFKSEMGFFLYKQIRDQIYEETILNFLIEQVLGKSEPPAVAE